MWIGDAAALIDTLKNVRLAAEVDRMAKRIVSLGLIAIRSLKWTWSGVTTLVTVTAA